MDKYSIYSIEPTIPIKLPIQYRYYSYWISSNYMWYIIEGLKWID